MILTKNHIKDKINNLWQVVGNTPMMQISYRYRAGVEQSILVKFNNQHPFTITVKGTGPFINAVTLNGKPIDRNWISQQEVMRGGQLTITAAAVPNKRFGVKNQWITDLLK